jgi:hypothetical protein
MKNIIEKNSKNNENKFLIGNFGKIKKKVVFQENGFKLCFFK